MIWILILPLIIRSNLLLEAPMSDVSPVDKPSSSTDDESQCFIESLLASYGITPDKLKYFAIGLGGGIIAMFITIVGLSIGICCLKSKYKRKKERVWNMSDSLERERRYAEFLEFQKRSNQPPPLPIPASVSTPLPTPVSQSQQGQVYQITPLPQ